MHRLEIGDFAARGAEAIPRLEWPIKAIFSSSSLAVPAKAPAYEVGKIVDYCKSDRVVVLDDQGSIWGLVFPKLFIKNFNRQYHAETHNFFDVLKQLEDEIEQAGSAKREFLGELGWTTDWVCVVGGEDKAGPWCNQHNSPCTPIT